MDGPAMTRRAALAIPVMVATTFTLAVASTLHFGLTLLGVHDLFRGAALPEAIIAAVLAAGASWAVLNAPRARGVALAATAFGVAGFVIGLRFTLAESGSLKAGDVAYHLGGLALLVIAVVLLLPPRSRSDA